MYLRACNLQVVLRLVEREVAASRPSVVLVSLQLDVAGCGRALPCQVRAGAHRCPPPTGEGGHDRRETAGSPG
jgi:hypothetical protein